MSKIKVEREPEGLGPPFELCCFCNTPTPFWVEEKDVACCTSCAQNKTMDEVPSKDQWFENQKVRSIK